MSEDQLVRGGCLCGAVVFEIVLPTKWCANCHCSLCRRAHGAAFVTWIGVEEKHFRVVEGAGDLAEYRSSESGRRQFCRHCGSTLLFRGERWPDEVHVVRAAVMDEIDRPIQAHAFFDDRAHWHEVNDDLPRLGGPNGNEPLAD